MNVRSGPGTSYKLLGTAAKGAILTVTQPYYASAWHEIVYNNQKAYINTQYLRLFYDNTGEGGDTPGSTIVYNQGKVINVNESVNLRTGPSTAYAKAGTAAKNQVLEITKAFYNLSLIHI